MTVFISGHTNLKDEEFDIHYKPALDSLKTEKVLIGNAYGADKMAFDYLISKGYPKHLITIFCYGRTSVPPDYYTSKNVTVIDEFKSYTSRDAYMTNNSDYDILWVRPDEETKKMVESEGKVYRPRVSGTELNRQRRLKKGT